MNGVEKVFNLEDAAARLEVTPEVLLRLVRVKKIGFLKSGRVLTFPASVIQAYIDVNKTAPAPSNPFGLSRERGVA